MLVLYFGTYDPQLLGLADNVDPYNSDSDQKAILFTDTFALFDVLSPDITAISQVLANTTAHEIGHLLGLRHTADIHDIMDTTANARQMLHRQWFTTANLNPSVIDFGQQDAPDVRRRRFDDRHPPLQRAPPGLGDGECRAVRRGPRTA